MDVDTEHSPQEECKLQKRDENTQYGDTMLLMKSTAAQNQGDPQCHSC